MKLSVNSEYLLTREDIAVISNLKQLMGSICRNKHEVVTLRLLENQDFKKLNCSKPDHNYSDNIIDLSRDNGRF